jgi:hypothetical protein
MKQLTALGQGAVLPKIVEFGSGVNHPHNIVTKKVTLWYKTKHCCISLYMNHLRAVWLWGSFTFLPFAIYLLFWRRRRKQPGPCLKYFA